MTRTARSRLAPSPTGAQHVGNARTYLIAWLSARSQGASIVLRIEDIDSPRVKSGAESQIIDDLRRLGLDWDEGPIRQTDRIELYLQARDRLGRAECIYPCTCTRTEIAEAASAPHAEHEGPVYPGTCAGRCWADRDTLVGRPFAWRFRIRHSPTFADGFRGWTTVDIRRIGGDFVVWKNVDTPAYQLAVTVDDAEMGITEVVRGDDLVVSTPRQLLLFESLGHTDPPTYYHVPLVVGTDGRRLAKRHGDTRLTSLWHRGVRPEQLVGFLAWSCGWIDRPQPITAQDLLPLFRWDSIPRSPFVFGPEQEDALLRI